MMRLIKESAKSVIGKMGYEVVSGLDPVKNFHSDHYLRHTARRLEHLASLRIPLAGLSVLEVGAGIGDLSHYYLDRGCSVTITEAREDNLQHLRARYPNSLVRSLDLESPDRLDGSPFDVVHCYGLLYHLSKPKEALAFLGASTRRMLLLETCVSFGEEDALHRIGEVQRNPTQAVSGTGCRPTRGWIFRELQELFPWVYLPMTQPCHEEFPLDWSAPELHRQPFQRAIFIASRNPLENPLLTTSLISTQVRHD